jgi:hypothetical protein
MFGDGSLTFREFAMRETLPLATIHDAVLEFLRGRNDAVLFGAHAVNAYVDDARTLEPSVNSLRPDGLLDAPKPLPHDDDGIANGRRALAMAWADFQRSRDCFCSALSKMRSMPSGASCR